MGCDNCTCNKPKEMNQEVFNEIMKALVFASTCDCSADASTLHKTIEGIEVLLEANPKLIENLNLDGISLFGNSDHSEEPEKYKKLVEIFGDKLKIDV